MAPTAITRRRAMRLIGAIAAGGIAVGCGSSVGDRGAPRGRPKVPPLRVGLVVPRSGVYASLGTDMERGWDLWLEQHGHSIGGLDVDTTVADEGDQPDVGVAAVQHALDRDVDVLVGVVSSPVALGAVTLVEEARKLFVIANAGADQITGVARSSPYIWRTSFTNSQVSRPLGAHMAGLPEIRDAVFAIAPDYAAGPQAIAGFKAGFGADRDLAGERLTPFTATHDFHPYLTHIRATGARAVFCFYAGAEAVSFVAQFAELGLADGIALYASGFLTEGGVLQAQGTAAIGIRTSLHYSTELTNPANTAFVDAYTGRYGELPTVFAVQAWDAALVLDRAVAGADELSGDALAASMARAPEVRDSPRGPWRFEHQSPRQRFHLREVRRGDGRTLVNAIAGDLGVAGPAGP